MEVYRDKIDVGVTPIVIEKGEDCILYKLKNDTGEGTMTQYSVFPGIDLLYNDFHMQSCISEYRPKVEMLGIDHCREGRIEWELPNNTYMYLQAGDLQVNTKEHHAIGFELPVSHYHGITIAIYMEQAKKTLSSVLDGFSVDLDALRQKVTLSDKPFVMRADDSISHIFSELYTVPHKIRRDFLKIKVLELLLFLSMADAPANSEERAYFPRNQVKTVKEIMKYMTANLDRHFTLNELSVRFHIPLTTMKVCFKGVYGTSIYAYMRAFRMQSAAALLIKTNDSVISIAGRVGYDNSSKFAAAFKEVMGISPLQYRKSFVYTEHI